MIETIIILGVVTRRVVGDCRFQTQRMTCHPIFFDFLLFQCPNWLFFFQHECVNQRFYIILLTLQKTPYNYEKT